MSAVSIYTNVMDTRFSIHLESRWSWLGFLIIRRIIEIIVTVILLAGRRQSIRRRIRPLENVKEITLKQPVEKDLMPDKEKIRWHG